MRDIAVREIISRREREEEPINRERVCAQSAFPLPVSRVSPWLAILLEHPINSPYNRDDAAPDR